MANKPQGLKVYYPRCRTCAYAKANRSWYLQLLKTSFFDPSSPEKIADFYHRTSPPVPYLAFYRHLQNHTTVSRKQVAKKLAGKIVPSIAVIPAEIGELIEQDKTNYEDALDETIKQFHANLRNNKIPVTLSGGLAALKIKADIQKSNKDRKVDLVKLFANRGAKDDS